MPTTTMPERDLLEYAASDKSIRVDREAGIIRGVKLLGKTSRYRSGKVRREYSDQALQDAARLFESSVIQLDHPEFTEAEKVRKFRDGIGVVRKVRRKPDGVYGDLHLLKSHPMTPVVLESAEMMPDRFGMSHNAKATNVAIRGGTQLVEGVALVRSIDIVRNPATSQGLFEAQEEDPAVQNESIDQMILSVIHDTTADRKAKLEKIGKILDLADELQPADTGAADGDGIDARSSMELPGKSFAESQEEFVRAIGGRRKVRPRELMEGGFIDDPAAFAAAVR